VTTELDAPHAVPWGMAAMLETRPPVLRGWIALAIALGGAAIVALATWLAR